MVDRAVEWLFSREHTMDADVSAALAKGGGGDTPAAGPVVDQGSHSMLKDMGASDNLAKAALLEHNNNLEAAANWFFSVGIDLGEAGAEAIIEKHTNPENG